MPVLKCELSPLGCPTWGNETAERKGLAQAHSRTMLLVSVRASALLIQAASDGVDVYFDNVGGEVFRRRAAQHEAERAACGVRSVSAYDVAPSAGRQSVQGVPALFISRRLTLHGFIVSDFYTDGA